MNLDARSAPYAWHLPIANLLVLAGLIVAVVAGTSFDAAAGWRGLLVAGVFGASLSVGAILFIGINLVAGARWWDPIRDVSIALARTIPAPILALGAVVALGAATIYPWAAPGAMESNHLLHEKAAWLNLPFFLVRFAVIAVVWLALPIWIGRHARKPAELLSPARARAARAGAVSLVVLAITISVGAWDWTMSLSPEWFSTMYGVYAFAGSLQGGIAAIAALAIHTTRTETGHRVSAETLHDLGKLLFGFSMFWAYIWFCQFLLIWYSNLPEEVAWYAVRLGPEWSTLFWLNPILNFGVPFLFLLTAKAKRDALVLFHVSLAVLAGRWLDAYLLVEPSITAEPATPIHATLATLALIAAMWMLLTRTARGRAHSADGGNGREESVEPVFHDILSSGERKGDR